MPGSFAEAYPTLARWVRDYGWIELGHDGMSPSFLRVLDEGGMIWERAHGDESVDDALRAAEAAIDQWISDQKLA